MAAPIVSTLPAAPLPTDSRTQFNNKAYNFVGALVRFSTEINTLAEWINAVSGGISELGVIASSVSDTGGFSNAAVVASRGVRSASAYTLSMGYSASANSPSTSNITIELDAVIGQVKAKTISMGGTYVTVDNFLNAQMASHGWIGTPGASTANNTLISSIFSDLQGSANVLHASPYAKIEGSNNGLILSPNARATGTTNLLLNSTGSNVTGNRNTLLSAATQLFTADDCLIYGNSGVTFSGDVSNVISLNNSGLSVSNSSYVTAIQAPSTTFADTTGSVVLATPGSVTLTDSDYSFVAASVAVNMSSSTRSAVIGSAAVTLEDHDQTVVLASQNVKPRKSNSVVLGYGTGPASTSNITIELDAETGRIDAKSVYINGVQVTPGGGGGAGTVTSVGLSVPTGLTVSNSPVTSSGTLAVSFASGYSIPTTAKQTQWDTAYTDRNKWDGGSTGLNAATGRTSLGATTVGANIFTLANPSAISYPRINANNTVTAVSASTLAGELGVTAKLDSSAVGVSVASLVGGVVPSNQLPSYVDDVLEYANLAAFPATGETGKIYIAIDTNRQYRWSGSAYVQIVSSPGTTDNVPEGSTNQYFTQARVRSTPLTGFAAATGLNAILATDTILQAFNKIQGWLSGLGNASLATLVSSTTDSTSGRVVTSGWMGLGAGAQAVNDLADTTVNNARIFRVLAATPNASGQAGGVISLPVSTAETTFLQVTASGVLYAGTKSSATAAPVWRQAVMADGNQTIEGAKTFTSSPVARTLVTSIASANYDVDGSAGSGNNIADGYALHDATAWTNKPVGFFGGISTFKANNDNNRIFQFGADTGGKFYGRSLHSTIANTWREFWTTGNLAKVSSNTDTTTGSVTTVGWAGLGTVLGGAVTITGADLNAHTMSGHFYMVSCTNGPAANGYFEHFNANATNRALQRFISHNTQRSWTRINNGGTWTAWAEDYNTANLSANVQTMLASANNAAILSNIGAAKKTAVVAISTSSHILDTATESAYHRFTFSGAKTVIIRSNATHALATDGAWIFRNQAASGDLTVAPGAGVTINPPYSGTLVLAPGMTCTLQKVGTDTYDLIGQTVAA